MTQWRALVALRLFGTRAGYRMVSFVGVLSVGGLALALAATIGITGCASTGGTAATAATADKPLEVAITAGLSSVDIMHGA